MSPYRVRAVNTAPDSENKIHEDATAAAHGFRAGLVPGVTVYGYMIPPILDSFGVAWLERGAMVVRFHEPVYDGELVDVEAHLSGGGRLELSLSNGRATGIAWMDMQEEAPVVENHATAALPAEDQRPAASHETLVKGSVLGTLVKRLELNETAITAPLAPAIGSRRLAHPAVLLALANELLMRNVALGPWIHARSEVTNYASAQDGDTLTVRGTIVETYERKGHEFVVLDVLTGNGNRASQRVRHTAIWKPRFEPVRATPTRS